MDVNNKPVLAGQSHVPSIRLVGVGGSAGAVGALQEFFEALPEARGLTYIVVVHLPADYESKLPEILASKTALPVVQVNGRMKLQADRVYVIAPGGHIRVDGDFVDIADPDESSDRRSPIDTFLKSHAEHHPDGVVVLLSGGGTDGMVGVRHAKESGAIIMVQDPDEAEYDSIPRHALDTGLVDVVAPVRDLARAVVEYHRRVTSQAIPLEPLELDTDGDQALQLIVDQLFAWTDHDFSAYKRSTLLRRLSRRMHIVGADSLQEYAPLLRESREEAYALFRDLLITVTSFFRDPEAWEALAANVIPRLFDEREPGTGVRAWVAGCATGEEAYSLAILMAEHAAGRQNSAPFQIFATDLDERALQQARSAVYLSSIVESVSEERVNRFFERTQDRYRVSDRLREHVVFAPHNLLKDPPFSRLDLISCRNLLIYIEREMQEHIFGLFRYALRPGGILFLGGSEMSDETFATVSKAHRIYQQRPEHANPVLMPRLPLPGVTRGLVSSPYQSPLSTRVESLPRTAAEVHLRALEAFAPPSVLVDEQGNILHISENAGRFLSHPAGRITADLAHLIRDELRNELRVALFRAFEQSEGTTSRPIALRQDGTDSLVHLIVRPAGGAGNPQALVLFAEVDWTDEDASEIDSPPLIRRLEREIERTREQLRHTAEESRIQNAEMRVRNEELQSINEEYRSATEELETSKEELQSANEELQTVNNELAIRINEISHAHADLRNLLDATTIATIFLDTDFCIRRYTQNTDQLFNIRSSDIGRPLADLKPRVNYPTLLADARWAFDNLQMVEREIVDVDGGWFLVRQRPYRVKDRIEGVLLTFVDITLQKQAEFAAAEAAEFAGHIVDTVRSCLLVLDKDLIVISANSSFYKTFDMSPEEVEGVRVYELGDRHWDIPELRALLEEILPQDESFDDFEVRHAFPNLGERTLLLNARRLEQSQRILLAIEVGGDPYVEGVEHNNVREHEDKVRRLASALVMAEQRERRRISAILHDHLQQVLYGIQIHMSTLAADVPEALRARAQQINTYLAEALKVTRSLSADLSPPVLKGEGMDAAIGWLGYQMNTMYGLEVVIESGSPVQVPDEDVRVFLFQLVRELLFNVVKHADVREAKVVLYEDRRQLRLSVIDEGKGFDVDALASDPPREGHVGLARMRERLELFGGRLEVQSAPGQGTRATIVIPTGEMEK